MLCWRGRKHISLNPVVFSLEKRLPISCSGDVRKFVVLLCVFCFFLQCSWVMVLVFCLHQGWQYFVLIVLDMEDLNLFLSEIEGR